MNWTASHPGFFASPAPSLAGRLRVLAAGALALGLHAALLLPNRPTIIASAAHDAVPAMTVRLLNRGLAPQHATSEATLSAATAALGVQSVPSLSPLPSPHVPDAKPASRPGDELARADTVPASAASNALARPDPLAAAPATPVQLAPPPEPGLPPAPAYLAAGRLDPGPRPLDDIDPVYPDEAKLQEGSVVLRLLINEAGTVDNVAVVRAYPVGLFERSALEAFGRAKFSPGKLLGVAVKSQITIEVMFTPINRGARVSGRSY